MEQQNKEQKPRKVTIAVEGCCHGQLDAIYETLQHLERVEGRKVDLLICCGDFQALRNLNDLETMSVPFKYRDMGSFYKYYSGKKRAPVPTLFIGGNHEAANYLWELYYGGWSAPNIYFLGYAGVVRFAGLRIGGISGIWSQPHYGMGHWERPPYNESSMRSAYHVRELEVFRLLQIRQPLDIFLSHDWPQWITLHGNKEGLFRKKPYFQKEAERGDLGSPVNQQLLDALQPAYWFSAHLHCKFVAVVPHGTPAAAGNGSAAGAAAGPITNARPQSGASSSGRVPNDKPAVTLFAALDKCLPNRDFLQVVELDAQGPLQLEYDEEWLAIMRATHHHLTLNRQQGPLPASCDLADHLDAVRRVLASTGSAIPDNFQQTAEAYNPSKSRGGLHGTMPAVPARNPQTVALLELLGLPYTLDPAGARAATGPGHVAAGPSSNAAMSSLPAAANPEEIDIDDDVEEQEDALFAPVDLNFASGSTGPTTDGDTSCKT